MSQLSMADPQLTCSTEATITVSESWIPPAWNPSGVHDLKRRRVLRGEGLTMTLRGDTFSSNAEALELMPWGMAVSVADRVGALPNEDETLVVAHTGRITAGICHSAKVTRVAKHELSGASSDLVEFRFCSVEPRERLRGARYGCPRHFPAVASTQSPLLFGEWMHFRIKDIGPQGATMETMVYSGGIIPGLTLTFRVTICPIGTFDVQGRVVSIRRGGPKGHQRFSVLWVNAPPQLSQAIGEYLIIASSKRTPVGLRKDGVDVRNVQHAAMYDCASLPAEYRAILELRLRSHQHEGRFSELTANDMASPFDRGARHVTCRVGGRIIGCVRIIFVNGDPKRSQYIALGGHVVPDWLWKAGFVEAGGGAVDPQFQRTGLFLPLMQHAARIARQCGYRYVLGACEDELVRMYSDMGFFHLEARQVFPRPGWAFTSHLICLDLDGLLDAPPQGKWVPDMAAVVAFVGGAVSRQANSAVTNSAAEILEPH